MLPSLKDQFIADTYTGFLHTSNQSINSGEVKTVYDGLGNPSPLKISTSEIKLGTLSYPLSGGGDGNVLGMADGKLTFINFLSGGNDNDVLSVSDGEVKFLGGGNILTMSGGELKFINGNDGDLMTISNGEVEFLGGGNDGDVLGMVDGKPKFTKPTDDGEVFDFFPIGSVYFTAINMNPKDFIGGKWIRIGQGKFIASEGTGTDINSTTKTISKGNNSGEYSHTLTEGEIPAHTHEGFNVIWGHGNGDHNLVDSGINWNENIVGKRIMVHENSGHTARDVSSPVPTRMHRDGQPMLNNSGGGEPHNNTPPSFGLYMWQRVS